MGSVRLRGMGALLGGVLVAGVLGSASPVGAASDCRVRNVTQDSYGHSLIRMADRARDGDRLWVKGTCPGEVIIRADIVIRGVGERPTLMGRDRWRVVRIVGLAKVVLRGLTIEHGATSGWGGGVFNIGRTTIRDSVVRANVSGSGGGVANGQGDMVLTLVDSRVKGNRTSYAGGGVYNDIGSVRIVRSTVARNRAASSGGGITQASDEGDITMIDSSVRGNRAKREGGGILSYGFLRLTGSMVTDNVAGTRGGGIRTGYTLILTDSTVSGNVAGTRGGGIWNRHDPYSGGTGVTLEGLSSVSDNVPDDCVGTPAC
jgi:hypothetical protein